MSRKGTHFLSVNHIFILTSFLLLITSKLLLARGKYDTRVNCRERTIKGWLNPASMQFFVSLVKKGTFVLYHLYCCIVFRLQELWEQLLKGRKPFCFWFHRQKSLSVNKPFYGADCAGALLPFPVLTVMRKTSSSSHLVLFSPRCDMPCAFIVCLSVWSVRFYNISLRFEFLCQLVFVGLLSLQPEEVEICRRLKWPACKDE